MQPMLIKVNIPQKSSFSINRHIHESNFPGLWHFHDEYELTLILQSSGSRMVGDNIDRYKEGDLIFIGKNLPHTWNNDELNNFCKAEALVLHFMENFLGENFFELPEMIQVKRLLKKSKRGLKIEGTTRDKIIELMQKVEQEDGSESLISILSILQILSNSSDLWELSTEGFVNSMDLANSDRLNRVYEYIMNHFQENVSLLKVAAVACMCPTAFSRYFKSRTRKSLTEFLIELRIGYACKLLMNEEITVTEACYESGFQNLSNFNQQFKKIAKLTPKKYQQLHWEK